MYINIHKKVLYLLLAVVFCSSLCSAEEILKCAGCKTEYYLMLHLAKIGKEKGLFVIRPGKTGNRKAIHLLAGGELDFAFCCKPHSQLIKKFEIDPQKTSEWISEKVAKDPIVIVVNKDAGILNLTMAQLSDIFTGITKNWKEVGGRDLPIKTTWLNPSVESGVLTVFKEVAIGIDKELKGGKLLKGPSQLGNYCKVIKGAITFMGINSYKPKYGIKIKIEGFEADKKEICANKYPLVITYYLVYDKTKINKIKPFLDFVKSPEGTKAINEKMISIR